jgi:hypothetical protein
MAAESNTAEVKPVAACVPEGFKLSDAISTMANSDPAVFSTPPHRALR